MKKQAFTLIELLVVIAIIAILASILFPVFAKAKQAAKKSVTLSNLRQVSAATLLYMGNHDDTTVPLFTYDPADNSYPSAFGFHYYPLLLLPYMKSEKVFLCPEDLEEDPALLDSQGRSRFDPRHEMHHYVFGANPSYGYNYRYLNNVTVGTLSGRPFPRYGGVPGTALERVSETLMFAEATMKDLTMNSAGGPPSMIRGSVGYSRIEPPFAVPVPAPLSPYPGWTGTFPNAKSQGQLWGRFDSKRVAAMWLDGHVSYPQIAGLRGEGSTEAEVNRLWNGRGR